MAVAIFRGDAPEAEPFEVQTRVTGPGARAEHAGDLSDDELRYTSEESLSGSEADSLSSGHPLQMSETHNESDHQARYLDLLAVMERRRAQLGAKAANLRRLLQAADACCQEEEIRRQLDSVLGALSQVLAAAGRLLALRTWTVQERRILEALQEAAPGAAERDPRRLARQLQCLEEAPVWGQLPALRRRVSVNSLNGELLLELSLLSAGKMSGSKLKDRIFSATGIEQRFQRLFAGGREIRNSDDLQKMWMLDPSAMTTVQLVVSKDPLLAMTGTWEWIQEPGPTPSQWIRRFSVDGKVVRDGAHGVVLLTMDAEGGVWLKGRRLKLEGDQLSCMGKSGVTMRFRRCEPRYV